MKLTICSIIFALTVPTAALAAFVPDPTPPPVITQGSGTRFTGFTPPPGQGAPRQATGAGSR
jgi:hypothetical protein